MTVVHKSASLKQQRQTLSRVPTWIRKRTLKKPAGAGYLVPCPRARAATTDVTISMRMWPLHSDVAARSGVVLYDPPPGERIDDSEAAYSVQNLNRLQKAIVRTQWNNLHSVAQDCPHR